MICQSPCGGTTGCTVSGSPPIGSQASAVPWRPVLEQHIGRHISDIAMADGGGGLVLRPEHGAGLVTLMAGGPPLQLQRWPGGAVSLYLLPTLRGGLWGMLSRG